MHCLFVLDPLHFATLKRQLLRVSVGLGEVLGLVSMGNTFIRNSQCERSVSLVESLDAILFKHYGRSLGSGKKVTAVGVVLDGVISIYELDASVKMNPTYNAFQ